ncbi:MAG: bifunctional tetrahydrofolate synthase/dihydrofolate synthase [Gammaproteobacteria bacterium]|nr:bifunctional tetrahydrofolate synthase/dihydrofolate synthase [Gammaproteobacteria bacterium]MCP5299865.1 bifunctional tetrahydrofolate synthase/dihydrofolate synthase [Chromatiaceae bacterium]
MRFASLTDWLDWQAGLSPKVIDLGLERAAEVWSRLNAPALAAPVITIAGTNGKGSSAAFAEAILGAAGYRCGCYTSPHLLHYNERIRIDGEAVSDRLICDAFARVDAARGDIRLTYFEFGTLAALLLFAESGLDAVVLEVGLGGRLDAVNIIDPDVALITGVALDHQDWLGQDTEAIGHEKAGIMRTDRPAVYAGSDMPHSIRRRAGAIGASLLVAGEDFHVDRGGQQWDLVGGSFTRRALPLPGMRGDMQLANAAGVLVVLGCLADRLPVDQAAVRRGLLEARVPGRFEVRPGRPTWILDVAHNPQAAATLADNLGGMYRAGQTIALCGMLADKDAAGVGAALAARFDRWCLVDLSHQPRGMDAATLAARVGPAVGDARVSACGRPEQAMAEISSSCSADDTVVVFGSFLTVAAAMAWLEETPNGA